MPQDQTLTRTGVFGFLNFWSPMPESNDQTVSIPPNPKGFFANERTFLSWLQLCLILGSLGIGFINFSDSPGTSVSGFLFMIVTIGMMFYALAQYHIRANKLARKGDLLIVEY